MVYQKPLTATHSVASVGTSSTTALAGNTSRKAALFINDHATQTVWLAINTTGVANTGIRLNAAGGYFFMSSESGNLDCSIVRAIASGASTTVLVTEWV